MKELSGGIGGVYFLKNNLARGLCRRWKALIFCPVSAIYIFAEQPSGWLDAVNPTLRTSYTDQLV